MPWTPEEAREAGRRGGLAKAEAARVRKLDPETAVKELFLKASPQLARYLIEAATGALRDEEGQKVKLDPKTRIEVAKTCLEYGLGKPATRRETPKVPDTPEEGLVLT